jgi:hypothetical protein
MAALGQHDGMAPDGFGLTLIVLPRAKAIFIAANWVTRAPGFE